MDHGSLRRSALRYIAKLPRAAWLLVALAATWMAAPHVREFVAGFLDGAVR
ncbi:hypothetical protein ACFPN1_03425 [Lysobacter yangpyeongensis]|uniref:Uncharacterized protein n=1 Tax=Lysobacter yangpyeongensis TaxID=346182 RepID=A0ABW0SJA9_9GAMM